MVDGASLDSEYGIKTWIPRNGGRDLTDNNWRIWYDELINYNEINLPWIALLVAALEMF